MEPQTTCPHCGRPNESNAGDYYHRKDCEARKLRADIDKAVENGASAAVIWALRDELEQAEEVGD